MNEITKDMEAMRQMIDRHGLRRFLKLLTYVLRLGELFQTTEEGRKRYTKAVGALHEVREHLRTHPN